MNKIGKAVDRSEWSMSPPTVNAYYRPPMNDINFPAGILQPPFYDNNIDDAVNYGGIGAVIGHELTHGFDDQGSQFDSVGNFKSWWTPEDRAEFDKRTQCIADQYESYVAVDDVHLKGRLTLGENTADNGGVRISYLALQNTMKDKGGAPAAIDGFTPEQRFFLAYRSDLVPERYAGKLARARIDRSALAGTVPGEWRGLELDGIPEGLRLQGRSADGERERLPRVVRVSSDCNEGSRGRLPHAVITTGHFHTITQLHFPRTVTHRTESRVHPWYP